MTSLWLTKIKEPLAQSHDIACMMIPLYAEIIFTFTVIVGVMSVQFA